MRRRLVALLAFVTVVAGIPAAVAAQDATPVPVPTGERTDIRYFVPFGPDGLNPTLQVADEIAGSCGESSLANIGRPDAWFCNEAATGALHDPCFENPFGAVDGPATLACVSSPFTNEVILLTTEEPLPREKDIEPPLTMPTPPDVAIPAPGSAGGPAIVPGQAPVPSVPSVPPVAAPPTDPSGGAVSAEMAIDPLSIPWAVELANGERCGLLTGATAVVAGMRINYGCEGGGSIVGELDRSQPVWTGNYYDEQALGTELVEVATVWT